MAVAPMYFQTLTPEQANPYLYGASQRAQIAGQWQNNTARQLQNQQLSAQLPYAGPMAQAQLQGADLSNALQQNTLNYAPQMSQQQLDAAKLANALQQNTLNYAPQTSQANINNTNAQAGYYGSSSQKNIADTGLINQQKMLYLYSIADPATKILIGRQIMMNGGFPQNVGNAQQSAPQQGGQQPAPPPVYSQGAPMPPAQAPMNGGGLPGGVPMRQPMIPNNAPAYMQPQQPMPMGNMPQQAAAMPQQQPGVPSFSGANNPMQMPNSDALYSMLYSNQIKGMGKDPTMGTNRGGAGGTFNNPFTGQTTSSDTNQNTTLDQRTIAALPRVTPLIQSLYKNLAPFQSAGGQAELNSARIGNYIAPGLMQSMAPNATKLPGMYAQGQSALETAPESLLRGWGLPVTNESLERMEAAVKPIFGETGAQYQQRLIGVLHDLQNNSLQSQGRLKSGINVDGQPPVNQASAPPQIMASKVLNGTVYHKINGQWYEQ